MKVIVMAVMIAACVYLCLHWGFMGVIVSTVVYGLWANCTEDHDKQV